MVLTINVDYFPNSDNQLASIMDKVSVLFEVVIKFLHV